MRFLSRVTMSLPLLVVATALSWPATSLAAPPANGWVTWASNRKGGRHEVYLMKADGTGVKQLTTAGGVHPTWSADGKWIAYVATDSSTHVIRSNATGDKKICAGEFRFWMHDNSGLVCGTDTYYLVNATTGSKKVLFKKSDYSKLSGAAFHPSGLTHDGRYLVGWSDRFRKGYAATNGTFRAYHSATILDTMAKNTIYFFGDGCEPTTPPTGNLVFHVCGTKGQCPYGPDIVKMDLKDLMTRRSYQTELSHADKDWGHEYFPRVSTDGLWLTYGATTDGCHNHKTCDYEIFVHKLGAGNADRVKITANKANDSWPHLFVGTLWVPPSPTIALAPTSLTFTAKEGSANPPSKTVAVTNGGAGTLGPLTTKTVYASGAGWLTIKASGAGNALTLTHNVDIKALKANTYSATVEVSVDAASNSPQNYTVTVIVTPKVTATGPSIALAPASVTISAVEGSVNPAPVTVQVANGGGKTLSKVSTKINYAAGASGWLTIRASGSGNNQALKNIADIKALTPNTYSATIEVSAAGAKNSPQNYAISLTVKPASKPATDSGSLPSSDGGVADGAGAPPQPLDGAPSSGDGGGHAASEPGLVGGCRLADQRPGGSGLSLLLLLGLVGICRRRRSPR